MDGRLDSGRLGGFRIWVGGVLYVEGVVCLLLGLSMALIYWPPYAVGRDPANPISVVGCWITGFSVAYMIVVGLGLFAYSLLRPQRSEVVAVPPVAARAARYRVQDRSAYLFDDTITCEEEADEAQLARQLY